MDEVAQLLARVQARVQTRRHVARELEKARVQIEARIAAIRKRLSREGRDGPTRTE